MNRASTLRLVVITQSLTRVLLPLALLTSPLAWSNEALSNPPPVATASEGLTSEGRDSRIEARTPTESTLYGNLNREIQTSEPTGPFEQDIAPPASSEEDITASGDEYWWAGFPKAGMNGSVFAITHYDGKIVVGGSFTQAGGVAAQYIAVWDGTSWSRLGTGPGMDAPVRALAVYNGKLFAGGDFTHVDYNSAPYIAQWDGVSWSSVGMGMNGPVLALAVYNMNGPCLIAGGSFSESGGSTLRGIGYWDGTTWLPIGLGVGYLHAPGQVRALAIHGSWLVAGGFFDHAGETPTNNIARWDGSWSRFGFGSGLGPVHALTIYNGLLVAGGKFDYADPILARNIAAWDGTTWNSVGGGTGDSNSAVVYSLTEFGGNLVAGGFFDVIGGIGGIGVSNIAQWDGVHWSPLASGVGSAEPSAVRALAVDYDGQLLVGGDFLNVLCPGFRETPGVLC